MGLDLLSTWPRGNGYQPRPYTFKKQPTFMKVLFRQKNYTNICYGKIFMIIPRRWDNKWHWLSVVWIKAEFTHFDYLDGDIWEFTYLTTEEMIQERLTHNLVIEQVISDKKRIFKTGRSI